MQSDKNIKHINGLISDIDCLEPLYKWTNEINIFNVLRLDRVEIRHSNMLSWLLSPQETHGLGDKFLKKFLIYATNGTNLEIANNLNPIDVDLMDLSDSLVYREKNNIDVLLISEKNRLVFAIENKISTGEHSNQLNRYRELLQKEFGPTYHYILIFLTPEGLEPTDTENWISMDYNFVLNELNKLLSIYEIPDKAKVYIDDYIKAIRRNVVEDKELKDLCKKIYFKHKEAFDLIFENKPDIYSDISDYIFNYLKENEERFNITVWNDYSKNYIRFTPNELVEKYGTMGSEEWCHNKNMIGFEIQNFENCDLTVKVILGPCKPEFAEVRQHLFELGLLNNWKMKGKNLKNKWKTIKSNNLVLKEKLCLENMEFVEDLIEIPIENYVNNELPKIVKILSE